MATTVTHARGAGNPRSSSWSPRFRDGATPGDPGRVTVTAHTDRACGGRLRPGHWRLDPSGRRPRTHGPPGARRTEPEDFALCLALLDEAIARAERWCARRERALADFDLRAAEMVRLLRNAGMLRASTRWEPA
jgi:hypothetical protein